MSDKPVQRTKGKGPRPLPSDFAAQIQRRLDHLTALDTEIAELRERTAPLPEMLTAVSRHPTLWLLIGREGVDRPGALDSIVGQQIITVTRHNTRVLVLIALGALLLGILLGAMSLLVWMGGI